MKQEMSKATGMGGRAGTCAVICAAGAVLFGMALPGLGEQAFQQERPNFIVILADDLGYADVGCYGGSERTPNIDRLAAEGLRFTDFHANGPVCSPTRAALLSGRYQQRMGIENALESEQEARWPPGVVTIADRLRAAGYATGAFGKWHLGNREHPMDHGFDDYAGNLHGGPDYISHLGRTGEVDWWQGREQKNEEGYNDDLITDYSLRFIRKHKDSPFFLYVPYSLIHFPWMTPEDKAHREPGGNYTDRSKLGPHRDGNLRPVVRRMIEELDKGVGRILDALRENHLEDRTFVLFLSDNGGYRQYAGEHLNEISDNGPWRAGKGSVYEGGHRVPCIAWWPGQIRPATVSREPAMTMDLMPTILELAGLPLPAPGAPESLDGISLNRQLLEGAPLPKRDLFWKISDNMAMRRGPWKLAVQGTKNPELYNLEEDQGEENDLAGKNPAMVGQFMAALRKWEEEVRRKD